MKLSPGGTGMASLTHFGTPDPGSFQETVTGLVRGHVSGWAVHAAAKDAYEWTAFCNGSSESGTHRTRSGAEFHARNALDRLRLP